MAGEAPLNGQFYPLRDNPIPWLLEASNPSVRYWTLVDVLEQPLDASLVMDARSELSRQPIVYQLLELQQPDGHWGEDKTKPYTASGTLGVLSLLYQLGMPANERTSAGCHSFLQFCQHECGGFSMAKTRKSGIFPCTTGEQLPWLAHFGFGDDPRVQKAFHFLLDSMSSKDALVCSRYQHKECLWGAIAGLKGLAVLPDEIRSAKSQQVIKRLAEALLKAPYDFSGEHKRWLTFGVPRAWDLIAALVVLALHGYGADPGFQPLLERIYQVQDENGRWICGSISRTWPLERRNKPSKWVTLDMLRILKIIGHPFTLPT